jgi:hypothetical protein
LAAFLAQLFAFFFMMTLAVDADHGFDGLFFPFYSWMLSVQ